MTVALLGSLLFMGFAGTAAAHDYHDDKHDNDKHDKHDNDKHDKDRYDDKHDNHHHDNDRYDDGDRTALIGQSSHAETNQYQKVNQENNLKQGDNVAAAYKGDAAAANFASQSNSNAQIGISSSANFAGISQK
ncbi:membrane protein involved in toxin uptake [Natronococcus jeotgali DSM 18795]|uniref:Membrane protein involved in toxin uptake n=2 Tax=Natronococcus jeotgali TaxID=413812 RepID=L9XX41_9EURY|nr:membrane protein involved in toxin uptake [Natronococcus jeotgali DSM 18795]